MLHKASAEEKRRKSRLIFGHRTPHIQDCTSKKTVALFGSESKDTEAIADLLLKNGYEVLLCSSFTDLAFAADRKLDALLVNCDDQEDDLEVLDFALKLVLATTHILMISDQTNWLEAIGEQYRNTVHVIGKKWQSIELILQLKSLIRKANRSEVTGSTNRSLSSKTKSVDFHFPAQVLRSLNDKELLVANTLFKNANDHVSRESLASIAWNSMPTESRVIDVTVCRVRKKLNLTRSNGFHLISIYGFGYSLQVLKS